MESILFQFFHYDLQNGNTKLENFHLSEFISKNKIRTTIKWNNLYMNVQKNKIEKEHKYILKKQLSYVDVKYDKSKLLRVSNKSYIIHLLLQNWGNEMHSLQVQQFLLFYE